MSLELFQTPLHQHPRVQVPRVVVTLPIEAVEEARQIEVTREAVEEAQVVVTREAVEEAGAMLQLQV